MVTGVGAAHAHVSGVPGSTGRAWTNAGVAPGVGGTALSANSKEVAGSCGGSAVDAFGAGLGSAIYNGAAIFTLQSVAHAAIDIPSSLPSDCCIHAWGYGYADPLQGPGGAPPPPCLPPQSDAGLMGILGDPAPIPTVPTEPSQSFSAFNGGLLSHPIGPGLFSGARGNVTCLVSLAGGSVFFTFTGDFAVNPTNLTSWSVSLCVQSSNPPVNRTFTWSPPIQNCPSSPGNFTFSGGWNASWICCPVACVPVNVAQALGTTTITVPLGGLDFSVPVGPGYGTADFLASRFSVTVIARAQGGDCAGCMEAVTAIICQTPCNGTSVVCHNQNGIRNHRGSPTIPIDGPNGAIGNAALDAEWKIWGCENGMTRGSGQSTFTNWEIGATNTSGASQTMDIPDLELRAVVLGGGVREPDFATSPIASLAVGTIALTTGSFRINVSVGTPMVAAPAFCPNPVGLPTLPNADVAMLFLYTPGEVAGFPTYYRNLQTTGELNTISNPSVPPGPTGNSYSGTYDGLTGTVTHYPIDRELYAEMGFFQPTLEVLRRTGVSSTPILGSGARELASGDFVQFRSEDWEAGKQAIVGVDVFSALVLSDDTLGSPLCLAPPGNPPGFLLGSLFFPGSMGSIALYPTGMTLAFLPFTVSFGSGLNCHAVADVGCSGGVPSVFTDMRSETPQIPIPPGLSGSRVFAANLYFGGACIGDGSNTVELIFL